jgi:hypothetical protein
MNSMNNIINMDNFNTKYNVKHSRPILCDWPIAVAARSKALICGRSVVGNASSNPTEGMDICLLRVLCVVR